MPHKASSLWQHLTYFGRRKLSVEVPRLTTFTWGGNILLLLCRTSRQFLMQPLEPTKSQPCKAMTPEDSWTMVSQMLPLLQKFEIPAATHGNFQPFAPEVFAMVVVDLEDLNEFLASLPWDEVTEVRKSSFSLEALSRFEWRRDGSSGSLSSRVFAG